VNITARTVFFQLLGMVGLVVATLGAIWLISHGTQESNRLLTTLGYGVAVVGITPAILVVSPPRGRRVVR